MGITLLNIVGKLVRKHRPKKEIQVWDDTPTLFAAPRSDLATEEARISVLSAAGGRPGSRSSHRAVARKSTASAKKTAWFFLLFIGTLAIVVSWQMGALNGEVVRSIPAKLFTAGQDDTLEHAAPANVEAGKAILAVGDQRAVTERPAVIEKMDVSSGIDREVADSSSMGAVELSLATAPQHTGKTQVSGQPSSDAKASAVRPATDSNPASSESKKQPVEMTRQSADRPTRIGVATDEKKPTKLASSASKEPDADVQLLEALLVHLRKSDEPKHK